ncbi:MAG: tRNA dihydrouridine synthase DusB [Verrucomicrobiales bacterium]|nr:tRNA dihydrouridine synthase DusB [Verrucomicrobiales bacterium]
MLPWLHTSRIPLYLAPMAGVTDCVFRQICKELGADVMVTEFVSAEGIVRRDDRTRKYTEFTDEQRPVGVQLFGAHPQNLAEAAKKIIDWKQPDFIDLNFGCPVNKVVGKNGGSSLLRDCPTLAAVAATVAKAVPIPVTAKIRIGWDAQSINAPEVVHILEDSGVAAVAIHGRTRSQGYSGLADWTVIAQCAERALIPVIGNGDISSGSDVARRLQETKVRGLMIGRAAMHNPWVFQEARAWLATGLQPEPAPLEQRWKLILRHCRMALDSGRYGGEMHTLQAMRTRLMAYTKGLKGGKHLRSRFCSVASLMELEHIAAAHLAEAERNAADIVREPAEMQS